jgi:hypothetical protein
MIIEKDEITIADIDEAIAHLSEMLKNRYGNRLTHQRKLFLMGELDSLLDARLEASQGGQIERTTVGSQ